MIKQNYQPSEVFISQLFISLKDSQKCSLQAARNFPPLNDDWCFNAGQTRAQEDVEHSCDILSKSRWQTGKFYRYDSGSFLKSEGKQVFKVIRLLALKTIHTQKLH